MKQDWVLDVLSDLKAFAQQNGMFTLAEHLDDTLIVAAAELAADGDRTTGVSQAGHDRITDPYLATGKRSQ